MLTAARVLRRWVAPACGLVATFVALAGGTPLGVALWGSATATAALLGQAAQWNHEARLFRALADEARASVARLTVHYARPYDQDTDHG